MQNKIALVTGATRGIGRAIAEELASKGAFVIGTATSEKGADTISAYLGDKGKGLVLNVADKESIDAVLEQIKEQFGDIDILVNNAGITRDNLLMRMKDEEWFDIMQTNLTSVFHLSKAMLRSMMKKRFGRIITIGSVVGSMGNPGQSNYCAAKAGLIGFSKGLAKEVASRGITVNVVAPGFIATDMTGNQTDNPLLNMIPLGKMGETDDVADAVAYLITAKYVTGEVLRIDGGLAM